MKLERKCNTVVLYKIQRKLFLLFATQSFTARPILRRIHLSSKKQKRVKSSSLSALTKIEELTAGSDGESREFTRSSRCGFVAQWLERATGIRKILGSIPGGAALCFFVWSGCQFFYLCRSWKRREFDKNDPDKSEFTIQKSVLWNLWKALQPGWALFSWEDYNFVYYSIDREWRRRVTTVPEQCSIRASRRAFNYAQGKTDTETNFVVTVGFMTKVDHQTTSKSGLVYYGIVKIFLQFLDYFHSCFYLLPTLYNSLLLATGQCRSNKK